MKGDRLSKIVRRVAFEHELLPVVFQGDAIRLLRAEHRRTVRIIKAVRNEYLPGLGTAMGTTINNTRKNTCDEILEKLTKGKRP